MMKKSLSLPVKIFIALLFGILVGAVCYFTNTASFTEVYLKPVGTVFINLLKLIVVPVVLLSMISGIVSMGDLKKVGSVGWKTVVYFLGTTALACIIGLAAGSLFNAVGWFPVLMPESSVSFDQATSVSFTDALINIFPSNIWSAFVNANMLQVIIIALLLGGGILAAGKKGEVTVSLIESLYAVFENIMIFIIKLSPVGVFTMMAWVVATQGVSILGPIAMVLLAAYIGYFVHALLVYSLSVKLFAGLNPAAFFKGAAAAILFAFTSASSMATLPVSRECAEDLGADKDIVSFVLPLGATVNMDGTAVYQSVASIFLAACCGMTLSISQMITIVVVGTLASVGTAGVSGAGVIMLAMVLEAIGIPSEMIMLIYGIDRLFDMGRTALNITGDISCTLCVTAWEKKRADAAAKK